MTSIQRPVLSSLYLYTMANQAKMELIEPKKPKEPEEPSAGYLKQPSKRGVEY